MVKPEYLTGECKTFRVWQRSTKDNWPDRLQCTRTDEANDFYSQPFTKDMIVRPLHYGLEPSPFDNWQPLFKGEWRYEKGNIIPNFGGRFLRGAVYETTDDFIREAIKAGIKLKWTTT